jgi:hypothetical protein
MSAQLEERIEQLAFEGLAVNAVRLSASLPDMDCRYDDEALELRMGDRVSIVCEVEVTDVHFSEKRKDVEGRSIGVGPVTRKHGATLVPGSASITSVQRRESEDERARRMTR